MRPNIAVIYGGDSSEYIVSVQSGKNVFQSIDTELFHPWLVEMKGFEWKVFVDGDESVEIDRSDFSFVYNDEKIKFDYAYIIIHGTPGEDGILQGYFDLLKIPYSTCGVHSSALTFNKYFCSNFLKNFDVPMAKSVRLKKGTEIDIRSIVGELGLPVFVKPNAGGSSFGITKVKSVEKLKEAVENAWKESDEALVEEFILGTEFTCGLVKLKNEEFVFPLTEVLPKKEFFDFEAKYTKGMTDEITPARLSPELTLKCQQLASKVYDLCNCQGIVRVDFILKEEEFYFLEINTTPGMTSTSFIPQQVTAMGMKLKTLLSKIIQDGLS
ncbi:D-alanine--D-alanine ligase [Sunxiuqinia sp. A32]|uniref:D-alanine--D-alanine ligase n=1 Tax=Sunxiuqinia sp. A32 TaxID=3461496 RepID=UPI004045D0F0